MTGIPIAVGALFVVLSRIYYLFLFKNHLTLDHTSSAVLAAVLAFLPGGTAAWAILKIFNLGSGYFLFGLRL